MTDRTERTPSEASSPKPPRESLPRLLLLVATSAALIALVCGVGWWRSGHRRVSLAALDEAQRQRLVEDFVAINPGIFEPAWYAPEIGFTLKRNATLSAWSDTFRSNEVGYRTGPLQRQREAMRLVLVGDSWTYGMGVSEEDSFPRILERLARDYAGLARPVETWTLALPSYNTLNELAAFWLHFQSLEPSAVVFVPSANDNQSTPEILPGGELAGGAAGRPDRFGDPHYTIYRFPYYCDSYGYWRRWRLSLSALRRTEEALAERGLPTFLFFLARWHAAVVHSMVEGSGLASPYTVVPLPLTFGRWLDESTGHGNVDGNELYAQLLYRLVAGRLGWRPLPPEVMHPEVAEVPLFDGPPPGPWSERSRRRIRELSRQSIPVGFRATERREAQWAGPGDISSGAMGKATTLLLRRPSGTRSLEVTVRRLDDLRGLYPLDLEVSIPSPDGGTRTRITIPGDGPTEHRFRVPVPADLEDRLVLDVTFEAERVGALRGSLVPRSLAIERIDAHPD